MAGGGWQVSLLSAGDDAFSVEYGGRQVYPLSFGGDVVLVMGGERQE